jgi:hypothetical protein
MSGALTFTATGGKPPYSFARVSGTGSIDAGTGLYTAPPTAGSETVRVTDSKGRRSDAAITVTTSGGMLAISPDAVSMGPGGRLTFVASGGTAPYTFSLTAMGSGSPLINDGGISGAYVAGASTGTDTIQVQDSALPTAATATATVNVTAAVTNVNYRINTAGSSFPVTDMVGGTAIPAGYYFRIENIGLAAGSQTVYWWVFLSDDPTLGSGDSLLDADSETQLAAGAWVDVPLTGSWPLASGNEFLVVMVAAADDLAADDNITNPGIPVTLTLPDYTGPVVHDSGTTAGAAFSGRITIDNVGTADGSQDVFWSVYASLGDTNIDMGDKIVGTGTIPGGLGMADPPLEFTINNTWPTIDGTYYLVADIFAGDDSNTGNNRPYTTAGIAVVAPQPPDYAVTFLGTVPWSDIVNTDITGQIRIQNVSANAGLHAIHWSVYRSADKALDAGDALLQSGSEGYLGPSPTSVDISLTGDFWPPAGQFYYLISVISAGDDSTLGNNTAVSHPIAVADVLYVEGPEINDDSGPAPPLINDFSPPLPAVLTLPLNGTIALEGAMDAFGLFDTYRFTAGAGVVGLSIKACWDTGFDDIDLYVWPTTGAGLSSLTTDMDAEPGGTSSMGITGLVPLADYFAGVSFWLANNTSGSIGRKYVVLLQGNPL